MPPEVDAIVEALNYLNLVVAITGLAIVIAILASGRK